MPELPEVEFGRKLAERVAAGRRVTRVWCADDPIVFDGVDARDVERALTGRVVVGTGRRGKYIWFELDRRPWPLFHFGMTGAFRVRDVEPLRLSSSPKEPDPAWPPRFAKIHLHVEGGSELVMTNARRLGRIRLRDFDRVDAEPPLSNLGFDPLLDLPPPGQFVSLVAARKTTLKALLLDQSFAAGVGNWIADEVLYQARLDPRRRTDGLDPADSRRLRTKLRHVVSTAVRVDADKTRFPRSWLFHRRWGKEAGAVTAAGEPIEFLRVAGRTTAWVPSVQS